MSKPNLEGFKLALNDLNRQLEIRRTDFVESFGSQDSAHPDCWDDYGYLPSIEFENFYAMYKRNPFASAVVDRPVDKSWQTHPWLMTDEARKGKEYNSWEREVFAFFDKHGLWDICKEADRMQSIGQYAGIIVEARDGKSYADKLGRIRPNQIESFKVVSEAMLEVEQADQNIKSTRYGLPVTYSLDMSAQGDKDPDTNNQTTINYTRVNIWAEGALNGTIYGNSSLEPVFNTLINIEKVSGAGGEGYYKSSRGSMTMDISTDSDINKLAQMYGVELNELPDAISDQVADFNKNFNSVLAAQGVDFKPLQITVPDPSGFMSVYKDELSAGTGIPLTEIIGQQTDERSSTENNKTWCGKMESRRKGFLNTSIARMVNWLMEMGAISKSNYAILWEDLYQPSLAEKLESVGRMVDINFKHAQTLSSLAMAGAIPEGHPVIFTDKEMREVAGYEAIEGSFELVDDYPEGEEEEEEGAE
jgi:uncharacterized protein